MSGWGGVPSAPAAAPAAVDMASLLLAARSTGTSCTTMLAVCSCLPRVYACARARGRERTHESDTLCCARCADNAQRDAAEARMRQWEHENFVRAPQLRNEWSTCLARTLSTRWDAHSW
ncbi:hypothetical protein EON67_10690 [archaeon]|nr:MAG: hypothetical protein EON67_10690 [archaeon]